MYAEGCSSVATQSELNHFVLSIVTNSNYLRFIHLYSYFLPDNMWLTVASGLSVFSHFMEAVGVSD